MVVADPNSPYASPPSHALVVCAEAVLPALHGELENLGYRITVAADPYQAVVELLERPAEYDAFVLSLPTLYREELGAIRTVRARLPHVDVFLAHTDGRQAALADAMRLGATGLLGEEGIHRLAAIDDVPAPAGARVLRGSNDVGEFSGYAEGTAAGGDLFDGTASAERALLVVNDRFLSYGAGARLRAIQPGLCSLAVAERLLVGAVEVFPGGGDYVKSNWMLLPEPADPRSFVPVDAPALDALVPAAGGPDGWIGRSTLDPGYAHRLEEWLSGEGGQLGSHWYQAAPFTEANWPSMRLKMRSILNEHLISEHLTAGGLTPIQIEQLEMLARMNAAARYASLSRARRDPASAVTFPSSPRHRVATALSALGAVHAPTRGH